MRTLSACLSTAIALASMSCTGGKQSNAPGQAQNGGAGSLPVAADPVDEEDFAPRYADVLCREAQDCPWYF